LKAAICTKNQTNKKDGNEQKYLTFKKQCQMTSRGKTQRKKQSNGKA
jgi:hypothetical protein